MALNNLGLGFLFTAKDLASAQIRKLDRNFKKLDGTTDEQAARFEKNVKQFGVGVGLMVAGGMGLKASFGLAGSFGEFEQGLARVAAISQATESELAALTAAATKAGLETKFSPSEAVLGLQNLASVGFSAQESITALNPALDLAEGGMISVEQSTATMSAALKAFGLDVDQAGITADRLLKITNLTSLRADELQLALGTVARGAAATKQSLNEMLPAMGLVRNTGVDVSVAASSVSSALLFMAKNAKGFKKIGVDVTDAQGNFRPFIDVIVDFNNATAGMTNQAKKAALSTQLFGRFGQTAANAISTQLTTGVKNASGELLFGAEAADFLREKMEGAAGTAAKFRGVMLNTFEGQKAILKGALQTLAVTLGKPLAEVLEPVLRGLTFMVVTLIKAFTALPEFVKKGIAIFFVGASALMFFGGAILAGKAALWLIIPVFKAAFSAIAAGFASATLAALPWILIIGGLIALGWFLAANWEEVTAVIAEVTGAVAEFFVSVWQDSVDLVVKALEGLEGIFVKIGKLAGKITGAIGGFFSDVASKITSIWTNIIGALTPVFDFVKDVIQGISNFIDNIAGKIDAVVDAAKRAGSFIENTGGFVGDIFGDTLNPLDSDFLSMPTFGGVQAAAVPAVKMPSTFTSGEAARAQSSALDMQRKQPPALGNLTINTIVDGQVVASTVQKFEADGRNRTFGDPGHAEDV